MPVAKLTVPIFSPSGQALAEKVSISSVNGALLEELDEATARANGEARWQIQEGREYEYELDDGLHFAKHPTISQSTIKESIGRIRPQNYVGRFEFPVLNAAGVKVGVVALESRSVKLTYREDYRQMLADIAERTAELLMNNEEFVFQHYQLKPDEDAQSLYQRFIFVRGLVTSDAFESAMSRICAMPLRKMTSTFVERSLQQAGRLSRADVRQIATRGDRVPITQDYSWSPCLNGAGLPRRIVSEQRVETVDNPENRFVKFVLSSFATFVAELASMEHASDALKREARVLEDKLDLWLSDPLFRDVGRLDRLALGSTVLQRREGYREVLKGWLMFEAAASIAWSGGEDVYSGGKKNVAVLYEYWVFFQLTDIISRVFQIEPKSLDRLIKSDDDRIELSLRQGRFKVIHGETFANFGERQLKVDFTYNRTFQHKNDPLKLEAGSWSVDMRPDYTLTLYPAAYANADLAERVGLTVHVHFDAKYRIQKTSEIFDAGSSEQEQNELKENEATGKCKRVDLLKMHAYNDAIRRTYGSYVIFPGDLDARKDRFFEILPGIGAFVLRPDKMASAGRSELEHFIRQVAESLLNRVTQREHVAQLESRIRHPGAVKYAQLSANARAAFVPPYNSQGEPFVPAEEFALIGFLRGEEHLDWIKQNHVYNFRAGKRHGALNLTPQILRAEYLMLHGAGPEICQTFQINKNIGPTFATAEDLENLGYPYTPGGDLYILIPVNYTNPMGVTFDVSGLDDWYAKGRVGAPMTASFEDLLTKCC